MIQEIDEGGSFASRLGSNLGQALSDQVPKEIERMRLSRAMKSAMDPNLSPLERFARAAPFLKDYPQTAQTFGDLARFEGKRKSQLSALRGGKQPQGMQQRQQQPLGRERVQENIEDISIDETPIKRTKVEKDLRGSPFRSEMRDLLPLTPSQRENRIADILESNDYTSYEDARALVDDEEAQKSKRLSALKEQDQFLANKIIETRDALNDRLKTLLQSENLVGSEKGGRGVYDDIIGEKLAQAQDEIEEALAQNPDLPVNKLIRDKSKDLLELAKATNEFKQTARGRWTGETIAKPEEFRKNFKRFQKIFEKEGMLDHFQKLLQSEYNMDSNTAAYFAYPSRKEIRETIDNLKPFSGRLTESTKIYAQNIAKELSKKIKPSDNLVAIAGDLKTRNKYFDSDEFLDYFEESEDIPLTPRQRRQLADRTLDWINWSKTALYSTQTLDNIIKGK